MSGAPRPGRRDALVALGVFVVAVAAQWPLRLGSLNFVDEGYVVQLADELLRGRRLYEDLAVYPWPGVFHLLAAAFRLFGTSIETARTVAVVVFAVVPTVGYLIARWWLPRGGALAVAAVLLAWRAWAYPHWQFLGYASLATTVGLVAAWATGCALRSGSLATFLAAGMAAGAAALAKQDSGVAVGTMLGFATLLAGGAGTPRWRRATAYAVGVLAVCGGVLTAYAVAGIGPALVRETVLTPIYGASTFDYPARPRLLPLFAQDPDLRARAFSYLPGALVDLHLVTLVRSRLWTTTGLVDALVKLAYHLPWLLLLATAPRAWRARIATPGRVPARWVLWWTAAGALLAFNRPHDWAHLAVLYPATLLLAASAAWDGPAGGVARVGRALTGVAGVLLGAGALWFAVGLVRLHAVPVHTPRGTLYTTADRADVLRTLLAALAEHPDAPLASLPYHPLVNFLAGRPNPSRHYVVWPVERDADRDDDVVAALGADPRTEVVYTPMQVPHYPRPATYAPRLLGHLADAWSVARVVGGDPGGMTFLLLRPGAPPAGAPLLAALPDATVLPAVAAGAPSPAVAALWPSGRALATTPAPGHPVEVAFPVVPTPTARLRTAAGVAPDALGGFLVPIRYTVAVRTPDGAEQVLHETVLDPTRTPADRGWRAIDVPLAAFAGGPVTLVLRTAVDGAGGVPPWAAGWHDPRLLP
jgi:hypothetical protein